MVSYVWPQACGWAAQKSVNTVRWTILRVADKPSDSKVRLL